MTSDAAPERLVVLGDLAEFGECCAFQQYFLDLGILDLQTAADNMQWIAERWSLVEQHGQDAVQVAMSSAFDVAGVSEEPDIAEEYIITPAAAPRTYQTAQSTIDAFWYVVRLDDVDHLTRWLADHPRDAVHLHKLWVAKCSNAAA